MITTGRYKLNPSAYPACIARRLLWRRAWLLAVPAVVIAAGAVLDWRIALTGLMLLFLVYPMIMTMTILRYATVPAHALRAAADHATVDGSVITLWHTEDEEEADKEAYNDKAPARRAVLTATIISAETSRGSLIVSTGSSPADIIIIPAASFAPDDLRAILTRFAPQY